MPTRLVVVALCFLDLRPALVLSGKAKANPMRRIITMLQDMQKELEAEGKKEEELYNKFMCYCTLFLLVLL